MKKAPVVLGQSPFCTFRIALPFAFVVTLCSDLYATVAARGLHQPDPVGVVRRQPLQDQHADQPRLRGVDGGDEHRRAADGRPARGSRAQEPPELATRLLEPTWTGPAWSARAGGAARATDPAARPASRARFRAMAMTWLPGPARPLERAAAAFDLGPLSNDMSMSVGISRSPPDCSSIQRTGAKNRGMNTGPS